VEVALLRAIQARNAVSIDAVLQQLAELRGGDGGSAASQPARPAAPVVVVPPAEPSRRVAENPTSAPAPAAAPAAAEGAPSLEPLWRNLLEAVGRVSSFTRSYFLEAHPVSLSRGVLTIGFDPEFADHLELVNNQKTHAILQTKLKELGQPDTQIKFVQAERPDSFARVEASAPPAPPTSPTLPTSPPLPQPASSAAAAPPARKKVEPAALNAEDFKNDPLIKKALEIFKGQIVEVRS
jgi:DNA polymerase-3 subunit gamma/tau